MYVKGPTRASPLAGTNLSRCPNATIVRISTHARALKAEHVVRISTGDVKAREEGERDRSRNAIVAPARGSALAVREYGSLNIFTVIRIRAVAASEVIGPPSLPPSLLR